MTDPVPPTIGPFRVGRLLGEGGMGAVYLGERDDISTQRVAIKILQAPDDQDLSVAHEEDFLTALEHPNIVRLMDRGVLPSGLRYFVMEYVDGAPIDAYCDHHRLSLRERIRLFLRVMLAVEYAHQRLFIHADLKPANIFVNQDGEAKLMDFGIASRIGQSGQSAQSSTSHYSPQFASPEQVAGERLTVSSDIYTLGIVARLLLTGLPGLPNQASDLEAIVLKALRPSPAERYLSVQEFAADLQSFLQDRPVSARRGNFAYATRKWMKRNRLAAAVAMIFFLVVTLSVSGVAFQAADAAQQRGIAQNRLHELVRLTGALDGELYDSVKPLTSSEDARHALLQGSTETLDKLAADDSKDPVLAIELARQYAKLAQLQWNEDRSSTADRHSDRQANARLDLDKGIAVLQRLSRSDGARGDVRKQLDEMLELRRKA